MNKKKIKARDDGFLVVMLGTLLFMIIFIFFIELQERNRSQEEKLIVSEPAKLEIDSQKEIANPGSQDISILIQNLKEQNKYLDTDKFNDNQASNALKNFLMSLRLVFN